MTKKTKQSLDGDLERFYSDGGIPLNDFTGSALAGLKSQSEINFANAKVTKTNVSKYVACHESHKPMLIPGTNLFIHGGSCISPTIKDADIYIGFDTGMQRSKAAWPWQDKPRQEIYFNIPDMNPPGNPVEFRALVEWTARQLKFGRTVHAGCIGGHGRTGTFFAALVAVMSPETTDAIGYVRKNYCSKAVETRGQIDFLWQHYGVKLAEGSKSHPASTVIKKPVKSFAAENIVPIAGTSIWD